jgi:hypothetical protein
MTDNNREKRLCSEIQLFDLCDLDTCRDRDGRYCTKRELLDKFEAIQEEDTRSPEQFLADELDESEEADDLSDDEGFDADDYEEDEDDE